MHRRSDRAPAPRAAGRMAALALALAGASSPLQAQTCDDAQPALATAVEQQAQGRAWESSLTLLALAEAGCVDAMVRLALLHWYGPQLHPGASWSRELALHWFERAALRGSLVARHMVERTRRTPPA